MNKEFFKNNRKKLIEEVEDNSIIVLFAGNAPKKSGDENYPFTPNRNFYYFTGIDEERPILIISKIKGIISERLFIKEIDEERERWVGKSIRSNEAEEISGVKYIDYLGNFYDYLNRVFSETEEINLYLDMERDSFQELQGISENFSEEVKKRYPFVRIKNIFPKIIPLRMVKSKEEIEEMKKAIKITIKGVESLMKNAKAGMKEYQLEAYYEFVCRSNGIKDYAFKTIAASGKNATILHYVDNNSEIKDGDLILFDLGAQHNYYNADITRTFPVNGVFSKRQKEVYNAVLRVNERVIKTIKPGLEYKELNKMATEWIAEECIKLGLIKNKEEVSKYYWHSIGHSLGLDTHDISNKDRNTIFKEGMVWTVEPGIYIEEESIGIRIEDDVLITSNGVEVLTKDMIKTVEDIEEFMRKK
ncbi:MAG: aminopeptidase P family protein [Clostridium sp.]|nr:aminopeptidase P family protein [Clostridium sp.]MCI7443803.1 aminopeptidase P family protein [Clostridium sp.]